MIGWEQEMSIQTGIVYIPNYNNFCPLKCYDTKMFDHLCKTCLNQVGCRYMFTCSVILAIINNYITILWLAAVCYYCILFINKK